MATLIFKTTQRCNSSCAYCEAIHASCEPPDVPVGTLRTVLARINGYLLRHPEERMTFTWHGGEPLLVGMEYFELTAELQDELCPETKGRIDHCLQSNLTLLTEEHIAPLKRLGMTSVGSSYDIEPEIRGWGEPPDSAAYNRAFLRATSLLERHGLLWGIIYVVTKRSLADPVGVLHTLSNLTRGGGFNMNPVVLSREAPQELAVRSVQYADFLGAAFAEWYPHRERHGRVEPFSSLLSNVTARAGQSLGCEDSGSCAGRHWNVDPAGNVSQCGRSCELGVLQWGNIAEVTFDELLEHRGMEELRGRNAALREGDCSGCRLFALCHGGCPIDGYVAHGSFQHKTGWCAARQRFAFEYFEPITGLSVEGIEDRA